MHKGATSTNDAISCTGTDITGYSWNGTALVPTGSLTGAPTSIDGVISGAVGTATQSIIHSTTTASGQAGAVKAAGDVALTGASNQANSALLLCAQGANREVEASGTGADDIAACQGKFATADAMANMAAQNGKDATLKRDEGMLNQEVSAETLDKFQKNFGVDKDDYVNRMLASHGKSSEFADMLSSKFSGAQLDKLFVSAGEVQPATSSEVAESASGVAAVKAAKKVTSLRDSLKAKLEAADAKRKLASAVPVKTDYSSIKVPGEKLQPHGLDEWVNGSEEQQETLLTIFDVVHQKIQSLKQRERI